MTLAQVSSGLWRGSAPQTDEDYRRLTDLNICYVINLERGWFEFATNTRNRDSLMTIRQGLLPIHIAMSDFTAPTKEELNAVVDVVKGGGAFVHCRSGVDRTGMLCAYYRVTEQGWPIQTAIDEMVRMGMHAWYRPFWIPALRKILETP